jgi:hypothetical protein
VTGNFTGLNDGVMTLYLEGEDKPLELTEGHRLFSATRGDWVPAVKLEVGEELQTLEGTVKVVRKVVTPSRVERVFNLEVADVHAYHVGRVGVLAHNQDAMCNAEGPGADAEQLQSSEEAYLEEQYPEQADAYLTDLARQNRRFDLLGELAYFVPEALATGGGSLLARGGFRLTSRLLGEVGAEGTANLAARAGGKGLTSPKKYFGSKTKKQVEEALEKKFGPPKSTREHAKTYYNPKTKRSFNVHQEPGHQGGKPHVDIRRRGDYPERKFDLLEE